MLNNDDKLYDFRLHYPLIWEQVVTWNADDPYELVLYLKDGTTVVYDYIAKYIVTTKQGEIATDGEWQAEFGRRLEKIMRMRGMSQIDLAGLCDISRQTISKYINGTAMPSARNVVKLSKVLDYPILNLIEID